MAPHAVSPDASSTATPVLEAASSLTQAGIKRLDLAGQAPLDAARMTFEFTSSPRPVPAIDSPETKSQKVCTDHMVTARWTLEHGWEAPELKPYGPLSLMPTCSVLHYATECFEGLKLYRGFDGRLRLFRVARNCERMRKSALRVALPDFDPRELEKMIVALCARDGPKWLPPNRAGHFLYIRPALIGTDVALGVQRPTEALLYVIIACFPDMSKASVPPAVDGVATGAAPGMKLLASNEDTIRAWPGGFGYAKLGANYGPSLVAQGEAKAQGFDQVLWLFGQECYVTEAGASNFFVVWRDGETGKLQLVTAPLEGRIILEGVTRNSILQLAQDRLAGQHSHLEGLEVVERRFTMAEIVTAYDEGRLVEVFAAGTAFFIAPVSLIHFRGRDLNIPRDGDSGVYARQIKQWLMNIMYGKEDHEWGIVVDEL